MSALDEYFDEADIAARTDAITGALAAGDEDAYEAAVVDMGKDGYTAAVLTVWARWLWCAAAEPSTPFVVAGAADAEGMREDVIAQGERLIAVARSGNPAETVRLHREIQRLLGDEGMWQLIWAMAHPVRMVLDGAGGRAHAEEVVALVAELLPPDPPAAVTRAVEPLGLALAYIAEGVQEAARTPLGHAVVSSGAGPHGVLRLLAALAARVLRNPGPQLVLDEDGIPDEIGERTSADGSQLLALATDLIRAIHAGDRDQQDSLLTEIDSWPEEDRMLLVWQLALTVGHRLAQHRRSAGT